MTHTRLFAAAMSVAMVTATYASIAQEASIKLAHPYSEDSAVGRNVERFGELVRERFGDDVDLEIYPSGQLIPFSQVLESLQAGIVDMSVATTSQLAAAEADLGVFDIPFLFKDADAIAAFQEGEEGRSLLAALEEANIAGIAYWPADARVIVSSRDLDTAEGLQGLRLRTTTDTEPYFAALGAQVVPMAFSEIYTALQTGLVDAADVPLSAVPAFGYQDVATTIIAPGHKYGSYVLSANLDFWSSLPDEIRQGLAEIAAQVAEEGVGRLAQENQAILASLAEQGIDVIAPSEDTWQEWRSAAEALWGETAIDQAILAAAGGTGGGGDPCPLGTCRCSDRRCRADCC